MICYVKYYLYLSMSFFPVNTDTMSLKPARMCRTMTSMLPPALPLVCFNEIL